MDFIIANWPAILQIIFAVLGVFSLIAKLTPTQADDKILDAILKIIHTFGLTK
jgi:hypothetical protein